MEQLYKGRKVFLGDLNSPPSNTRVNGGAEVRDLKLEHCYHNGKHYVSFLSTCNAPARAGVRAHMDTYIVY